jgi:uncharacterized SAM-binding protein YcdF (DUF218 family)
MIHFIKLCVGVLATPLFAALLIAVAGAAYRIRGRRRIGAWLMLTAAAIVYLGAIGRVGNALLGSLERQYPPLQDTSLPVVGDVMVLGGGYEPRDNIPVTAALNQDGLVRIVEGVRLARRLGAVRLIVSGGAPPGQTPSALGYAELARGLGINDASLLVLDAPLDTSAEAHSVAALIGAAPFILVTSAYHMPRAMRLMKRAGVRPIPAPTGQLSYGPANSGWRDWLPSSGGLGKTERALHEYLGLAAFSAGFDE